MTQSNTLIDLSNKRIQVLLLVVFVVIALVIAYFSLTVEKLDSSKKENAFAIVSNFIKSDDFNSLFVGEIRFEDKEMARYSKEFQPESDSMFDQAISWGKSKAFSVEAELHLVVESSFLVSNSKVEIIEKENTILINLLMPKLSNIDINYSKTVVNFKEVGLLADEEEREIFVIKEVFNKNIEKYKSSSVEKNLNNAKSKAKRIIKRGLLDIINMNKIIEVKFFE